MRKTLDVLSEAFGDLCKEKEERKIEKEMKGDREETQREY